MNKPVSSPPPVAASVVQSAAQLDAGQPPAPVVQPPAPVVQPPAPVAQPPGELGGQTGPEPTRYGDWEKNGRCTDF